MQRNRPEQGLTRSHETIYGWATREHLDRATKRTQDYPFLAGQNDTEQQDDTFSPDSKGRRFRRLRSETLKQQRLRLLAEHTRKLK